MNVTSTVVRAEDATSIAFKTNPDKLLMSKVSSSETLKTSSTAEWCFLLVSLCVSPDVFSLFPFGDCLWHPLPIIYCVISKIQKSKRHQSCCIMIHSPFQALCALWCLFFLISCEDCLRCPLHNTHYAIFFLLLCYAASAGSIRDSTAFLPSQSVFICMFAT